MDILEFIQRSQKFSFRITLQSYTNIFPFYTAPLNRRFFYGWRQLCDLIADFLIYLFSFTCFFSAGVVCGCGLLKVGVGSGLVSAVVALFKPRKVVCQRHKLSAPRWSVKALLRGTHGKRVYNPRLCHFEIIPMAICFCSICALSEMFCFMLTRYLDKESVSTSSGAPCPLEETKVVYEGKLY